VSAWVQTEILTETRSKKRIQIVEKFIDICEHLRQMNNFNGVFEIGSALDSSAIARIKNTLGNISVARNQTWDRSRELVNIPKLRAEINKAKSGVPYLGMFLTELTQVDEGNPNKTKEGLINMKKRVLIARAIQQIQQFQKTSYNYVVVPVIQEFLENISGIGSDLLYKFSLYIEPRPNTNPEMPEELKEIVAQNALLSKKKKRTTTGLQPKTTHRTPKRQVKKENTRREPNKTAEVILQKHREVMTKAYEHSLSAITCEELSTITVDKALEIAAVVLQNQYNSAITALTAIAGDFESMPERSKEEQMTVWDDPNKIPAGAFLPTLVEWIWNNDKGGFTAFDTQTALMIEIAYNKDKFGEMKLDHGFYGTSPGGYVIDFKKMIQIKVQTGFGRIIQRRMTWVKESEHRKKTFDLEIKVKSLEEEKEKLNQQIKELKEQIPAAKQPLKNKKKQ